jgi:hypothetical protein
MGELKKARDCGLSISMDVLLILLPVIVDCRCDSVFGQHRAVNLDRW